MSEETSGAETGRYVVDGPVPQQFETHLNYSAFPGEGEDDGWVHTYRTVTYTVDLHTFFPQQTTFTLHKRFAVEPALTLRSTRTSEREHFPSLDLYAEDGRAVLSITKDGMTIYGDATPDDAGAAFADAVRLAQVAGCLTLGPKDGPR